MAITVEWGTGIISVNKVDMVLTQSSPTEIYQLDMNNFRVALKDLEDSEDGMMFTDTHSHQPPVTISGAVLARVVEILDPFTVTFEDGQYRVNVVGANTNIGERVNVNQVSVSTSNSAGLQDLNSLQAASFAGMVTVDANSTFSGTTFPIGTRANPVNNMANALAIAETQGLTTIHFMRNMTLSSEDFSEGYTFMGDNIVTVTVTIDAGANISNCTFKNMTIQGMLDDGNVLEGCNILDIIHNNGYMHQCSLSGTVTLGGGTQSDILSCYSGIAGGVNTAKIDMGGSGQSLVLRDFSGGVEISNHTGADDISIDMASGQVIIESTVTAGVITCRGLAKLLDRSTGTATIDHTGLLTGTVTVQSKGFVLLDSSTSNTGTEYPVGTQFRPVNNLTDAVSIASSNNVKDIRIVGNYTTSGSETLDGLTICGQNDNATQLTITSGTSCDSTNFRNLELTGTINDEIDFRGGILNTLAGGISGRFHNLLFYQTTFALGIGNSYFTDCWTGVIGTLNPIFDFQSQDGIRVAFRNYAGPLRFQNKTGPESICLDLNSSRVTFDSTVTNGAAAIRGISYVIDNSTGTFTLNTDGMIGLDNISDTIVASTLPSDIATSVNAVSLSQFLALKDS